MPTWRVLIVEDDAAMRDLIVDVLREAGEPIEALAARTADEAIAAVRSFQPHVIFLDLNLERPMAGAQVCRDVRQDQSGVRPIIIVISGEGNEDTEVAMLEQGADDFISKSCFSPKILISHFRAGLRVAFPDRREAIVHGPVVIDAERHEATVEGEPLELTQSEFDILRRLAFAGSRALSRAELLGGKPSAERQRANRVVDVHVLSLRRKLGAHAWLVETVVGVGYRLGAIPHDLRRLTGDAYARPKEVMGPGGLEPPTKGL